MWEWMKALFALSSRMQHPIGYAEELARPNGSHQLSLRFTRNLWMQGSNTEGKHDVSVPVSWVCTIGKADSPEGHNGLQMKEVHLLWDTGVLAPFLNRDAVAFRQYNPMKD